MRFYDYFQYNFPGLKLFLKYFFPETNNNCVTFVPRCHYDGLNISGVEEKVNYLFDVRLKIAVTTILRPKQV